MNCGIVNCSLCWQWALIAFCLHDMRCENLGVIRFRCLIVLPQWDIKNPRRSKFTRPCNYNNMACPNGLIDRAGRFVGICKCGCHSILKGPFIFVNNRKIEVLSFMSYSNCELSCSSGLIPTVSFFLPLKGMFYVGSFSCIRYLHCTFHLTSTARLSIDLTESVVNLKQSIQPTCAAGLSS